MSESITKCLNEWNATIEALGQGKQSILIRKYGTNVDEFLLFPTVSYALKDNYLDSFQEDYKDFVRENALPNKKDSKFEVKIYNKDGTLAINKNVTFNINGVFYNRITDSNGVARLNINLRPGNYIITTIFEGLTIGNNINVLPTLVTSDLSMKYLDGSKFTAQTLDGQGNPLTNQNVSFNINGVLYQKVTDKEGIASLNITLLAGEYIITSYWNDFQVGNTIKID